MRNFINSVPGGRLKTILKKSTIESWFMLFDNEITNIISQHPFIDNFTWIRPKCNHSDYLDSSLSLFSNSNFYLIQKVYPNSIFSIPFIQTTIAEKNGGFISTPNTYFDSDCSFSLFNKQLKVHGENNSITEIQGVIRVPNKLHKHAISIGKYLKLPPHMRKYNHFSFLKIEASDKSYWNDKNNFRIYSEDSRMNFSGIGTFHDSCIDNTFNSVEPNKNFINPLINNGKNRILNHSMLNFSNVLVKPRKITCIHCQFNINNKRNSCYCSFISKSGFSPYRKLSQGFTYHSRGTGRNPFYFSIQKQLGVGNFTMSEFVGYLDDEPNSEDSKRELLQRIKVILKLNGSPDVQVTTENVQVIVKSIDSRLLKTVDSGIKKKLECFTNDCDSIDSFQVKAIFINTNFLMEHLFMCKDEENLIFNSTIVEQIVEYFDIIKNQRTFIEDSDINPFYSWECRLNQYNGTSSSKDNKNTSILSYTSMNNIPNEMVNISGILRPRLIYEYIWFIISQIAVGNYNWGLIHLEGVDTCNISFRYKPHGNDNNSTNSVNDLYILIFRINDEIFLISMIVVNNNDANI